jgi:hypothetical protein
MRRMKSATDRRTLVRNINDAFSAAKIKNTVRRLKPLKSNADFLDITNALGFLHDFTSGDLPRYKRDLTIPEHIRQFLTLAFRIAVLHEPSPILLRIQILPGRSEAVQITVTDRRISIRLMRPDLPAHAASRSAGAS